MPRRLSPLLPMILLALLIVHEPVRSSAAPIHGDAPRGHVIAPDLTVMSVEFGELVEDPVTHETRFLSRASLRMRPGRSYGWRAHLQTTRRQLSFTEVLTLPSAPKQWGITSAVSLSPDRRTATTTFTSPVIDRTVGNFWVFSDGDPLGRYDLVVQIEGVEVARSWIDVN